MRLSRRRRTRNGVVLCLAVQVVASLGGLASAATPPVVQAIEDLVKRRAENMPGNLEISVLPYNGQFPSCPEPRAFMPTNRDKVVAGRLSVGVRCSDEGSLRYIPVRVSLYADYVITTSDLARGDRFESSLLKLTYGDLGDLAGSPVRRIQNATGLHASRAISSGTPLLKRHLNRPARVERGQRVVVEQRGKGFIVTRQGEALANGRNGETVRVRFGRREVVRATVVGDGRLRIERR